MTIPLLPGNPPASLPATDSTVWYRMGEGFSPAASDVWWNRTEDTGLVSVAAEPSGWEAVEYVTPLDTVGGRNGALVGPQSIGPRVLDVTAVVVGDTPQGLRQRIGAVRRLLRGTVVWEQYDWGAGERLAVVCRPQGRLNPSPPFGHALGGIACRLEFSLVAATPWKYSVGNASTLELQLPIGTVSGRTYSKTYSWNYGSTLNPGGEGIAYNRGDEDAYPVFTVLGPVSTPIIRNETTGQEFAISGTLAAGQQVVIDARSGTVEPASIRLLGRPFTLVPGGNTIRWRVVTGSPSADARLTVAWRSTWQ